MSSANQVRLTLIEETTYGISPAGNLETVRYTSESLTGTPETTESQTIRTDRLSSGQVVTNLTVGGDIVAELAKEDVIDLLIKGFMYSDWVTSASVAADLTIVAAARTLDRAAGDYNNDLAVGDIITLTGFANSENNVQVQVASIESATQIKYVGPDDMVDEVDTGNTFEVSDYIEIGTTKRSFSIEKKFEDLTDKAINYRGMIIGGMALNFSFGEIVNATFSFQGNNYDPQDIAANHLSDGRVINSAGTTNSMNGSVDMPFIAQASSGTFIDSDFCIQSVALSGNNNLTPQTCIGDAAPNDYSEGTAGINIDMTAYFANEAFQLIDKKQTQNPFSMGFMVKNSGGYYGFYLPAIQVSFDDPQSQGINQDVLITMSGVSKVGAAGEKSLKIFRG